MTDVKSTRRRQCQIKPTIGQVKIREMYESGTGTSGSGLCPRAREIVLDD
jgi:hypothetical protein